LIFWATDVILLQIVELLILKSQIRTMDKISNYFRESYQELTEKVTWPSWLQLQQSTVIVLVATIIITFLVWIMDFASQNILKAIYSLYK
jgi:preprotein translocase subunit SecE